jgi:hypothetical protein
MTAAVPRVHLPYRKETIMSADHERRLLARAHGLADAEDLAEEVTAILGGARAARLDPDALPGLAGAALALGADSLSVYRAEAPRFADDRDFAAAVAEAEDGIAARAAAVTRLRDDTADALDGAREDLDDALGQLAAARAMPVERPCDGCHAARAAAVAAAQAAVAECRERVSVCETALGILGALGAQLAAALRCIRYVMQDLAEVYEAVMAHRQAGRLMPIDGDFLTGAAS